MKLLGREIARRTSLILGILVIFALAAVAFGIYALIFNDSDGSEEAQNQPSTQTQPVTTTAQVETIPKFLKIPPPIVDLSPSAIDVSAGWWHTCALHQDGTVSCWGSNMGGQIGTGAPNESFLPSEETVRIPAKVKKMDENQRLVNLSEVLAISSGYYHTCALHIDTTVSCWGDNSDAQIGHPPVCPFGRSPAEAFFPHYENESCASKVPNSHGTDLKGVTQISAEGRHTCALLQDGTVNCWGQGLILPSPPASELNIDLDPEPVKIQNLDDVVNISTGTLHSCGVHRDGTVSCWGEGSKGRLGDGVTDSDIKASGTDIFGYRPVKIPVKVKRLDADTGELVDLTQVKTVHSGNEQSCAIHFDNTASCWGHDVSYTDTGKPASEQARFTAEKVSNLDHRDNLFSEFLDFSLSFSHKCLLNQGGAILCLGKNQEGQLGRWTVPVAAPSGETIEQINFYDISAATKVTTGVRHTCVIYGKDNLLSCWGSNDKNQLGVQ